MIDALAAVCTDNLLRNKILIVPSYSVGRNIITSLASSKIPVFNLRVETVQGLVHEFGMPLLSGRNEILIDDTVSRREMFSVIYKMKRNNEFEYFTDIQPTPSVADIIWNAVMEIKYAGLDPDSLDETLFVSPEKARDIKNIIKNYDLLLKAEKMTDYPGLIQMLLESGVSSREVLLLVPNSLKLRFIERRFIDKAFSPVKVIYDEPVAGMDAPRSYYRREYPEEKKSSSAFASLFSPDERRTNNCLNNIRIMKAYGESNEVEAVLRDIVERKIPFDSVCIYTSAMEPYAQLLYQKAMLLGIDVTFGFGISVLNSRPGKAFNALIQWMASNYQVSCLTGMLYQELIEIPGENGWTITPFQAANALRVSGIGWGRERYLPVLDEKITLLQNESSPDDEKAQNRIKVFAILRGFAETVLNMLPESNDGMVYLDKLAKGISDFISSFAQVKSVMDAEAKKAITERLELISTGLLVELDEGLRIIEHYIGGIRIRVSGPEKGHIHLTDFDGGFYINRRNHYFIGFDADRFPGRAGEDPVLLDVEKQRISEHIATNRDKPAENLYRLVQLLAATEGNVTITYSAFDTAENRAKIPSPFVLQVYRMISGNVSADYSDLKNYLDDTKGYTSDNALDETHFWLNVYCKGFSAENLNKSVTECYPHLKHGINAWNCRWSDRLTCYDGYVGKLNLYKENEVFSASRLEFLAKCPYQYFLRYVLNVSPPEEPVYDPEKWLDPLQKGLLYHAVFERFYKTLAEKNEKPSKEAHCSLILKIAETVIDEFRRQIPPPNDVVFDIEKRDILESCLIFLASEEENYDGGIPVEFELAFGLDDNGYPPVEIRLGGERTLLLSGKIDRVDKLDENIYRIVDYKSGGTYGFSDRDFFKQGRQLQHALYAYALEVLLRNKNNAGDVKVREGVYLFPTRKGEGRRFIRVQRDRTKLIKLLNNLFDIIEEGVFAPTENTGDCHWCDYRQVCRVHRLVNVIQAKRNDQDVSALVALRGLRDYE